MLLLCETSRKRSASASATAMSRFAQIIVVVAVAESARGGVGSRIAAIDRMIVRVLISTRRRRRVVSAVAGAARRRVVAVVAACCRFVSCSAAATAATAAFRFVFGRVVVAVFAAVVRFARRRNGWHLTPIVAHLFLLLCSI